MTEQERWERKVEEKQRRASLRILVRAHLQKRQLTKKEIQRIKSMEGVD